MPVLGLVSRFPRRKQGTVLSESKPSDGAELQGGAQMWHQPHLREAPGLSPRPSVLTWGTDTIRGSPWVRDSLGLGDLFPDEPLCSLAARLAVWFLQTREG